MRRILILPLAALFIVLPSSVVQGAPSCHDRYEHCKRECYHSYGGYNHHRLNHCLNECKHEYNSCLEAHDVHHNPVEAIIEGVFGGHH